MAGSDRTPGFDPAPVFLGLFLACTGVFLLLSFLTADVALDPENSAAGCLTGLAGAWSSYGVILTLGRPAAYGLGLLLIAWGSFVARRGFFWATWPRVLGGGVLLLVVSILAGSLLGEDIEACGLLAAALAPPVEIYLGTAGFWIAGAALLFFGSVLSFGQAALDAVLYAGAASGVTAKIGGGRLSALRKSLPSWRPFQKKEASGEAESDAADAEGESAAAEESSSEDGEPLAGKPQRFECGEYIPYETALEGGLPPLSNPADSPEEAAARAAAEPLPEFFAEEEVEDEEEESAVVPTPPPAPSRPAPALRTSTRPVPPPPPGEYQLPPFDLLDAPVPSTGEAGGNIDKRSHLLVQTLSQFKIDGKVVHVEVGPRVTMFEALLAPGIHVNRVINLSNNIAMALKAQNVRIIAPIPNKDTIGIEIPNVEKEVVTLREIAESVRASSRKEALPVCLGKDVGGQPIVADLARMPHLLIAGSTGSGKSVCINSVIVSFLMFCRPEDAKLILIDPKVVELSRFKNLPHLMSPVITDMKRAVEVLEWACVKMDERYEQLSAVGVNHIAKFNALGPREIEKRLADILEPEDLAAFPRRLPYMVIIIDELADLMLVAKKDVEAHIARLCAKSRAVGIHVILATQRPSADIITGLIKANLPCRIAFQVATKVDSRVILDQNGAEALLGAGDMLYLPPGVGKLSRAQGVFLSDEELQRTVDFCRAQREPEYHADLEGPVIGVSAGACSLEDFDELFYECGLAIIESGRGSVSLLQRKLGIGYGRASRIIDQLASAGVLGPFREGKAREIVLTAEEFAARFGSAKAHGVAGVDGPLAGLRDDEREPERDEADDE